MFSYFKGKSANRWYHVSPIAIAMATGVTAFLRTTLEEPWSSASLTPAALIILLKIQYTMFHGFGWSGCIREKSPNAAPRT